MPDALVLWAVMEGSFLWSFASGGGELRRTQLPQDLHSLAKWLWVEGGPARDMTPCKGLPCSGRAQFEGGGDLCEHIQHEPCLMSQCCQPFLMIVA